MKCAFGEFRNRLELNINTKVRQFIHASLKKSIAFFVV